MNTGRYVKISQNCIVDLDNLFLFEKGKRDGEPAVTAMSHTGELVFYREEGAAVWTRLEELSLFTTEPSDKLFENLIWSWKSGK